MKNHTNHTVMIIYVCIYIYLHLCIYLFVYLSDWRDIGVQFFMRTVPAAVKNDMRQMNEDVNPSLILEQKQKAKFRIPKILKISWLLDREACGTREPRSAQESWARTKRMLLHSMDHIESEMLVKTFC